MHEAWIWFHQFAVDFVQIYGIIMMLVFLFIIVFGDIKQWWQRGQTPMITFAEMRDQVINSMEGRIIHEQRLNPPSRIETHPSAQNMFIDASSITSFNDPITHAVGLTEKEYHQWLKQRKQIETIEEIKEPPTNNRLKEIE